MKRLILIMGWALVLAGCTAPVKTVAPPAVLAPVISETKDVMAKPVGMGETVTTLPPPVSPTETPQTPPEPLPRTIKIGLALGGGAARGFAHVGVIQVLEEAGIRPDMVVGTSAGSVVAALYASGKSPAQLQYLAENMEEATITDWTLPFFSRGVLKGDALAKYINQHVGSKWIENMPIQLGIVAANLKNGHGILFRKGDTGTAVRASSAVPAVFQPVRIGGVDYVDGGLVAPVPARYTREMGADFVIAVDIATPPEEASATDTFDVLMKTFTIMGSHLTAFELKHADVVVKPAMLGIKGQDFGARRRSIEAGKKAMREMLPELKRKLDRARLAPA